MQEQEPLNSEQPEVSAETDAPQTAIDEREARCAELTENLKRAQADFINYKRYVEQQREERRVEARATAFMLVLPVLDDLDRALASVPPELEGQPWVEGVGLIAAKFHNILKGQGVEAIKTVGEAFDPRCHESVHQEPGPAGIITRELQKGYRIGERVIRPARVAVGSGEVEDTKV